MKKLNANAIILSGGRGSRLGYKEKGLLEINGERLIERKIKQLAPCFNKLLLATNSPKLYEYLSDKITTVKDDKKDEGPLVGIYSTLKASDNETNFITAVDMPNISHDLLSYLYKYTLKTEVVVTNIGGFIEPLFGFYSRKLLPKIEKILNLSLKSQQKGVKTLIESSNYTEIAENEVKKLDPELISFKNINTITELSAYKS